MKNKSIKYNIFKHFKEPTLKISAQLEQFLLASMKGQDTETGFLSISCDDNILKFVKKSFRQDSLSACFFSLLGTPVTTSHWTLSLKAASMIRRD
jgi:hypothetical protein